MRTSNRFVEDEENSQQENDTIEEKEINAELLDKMVVNQDHFRHALAVSNPSNLRETIFYVPNISWDGIGSLEDVKRDLNVAIADFTASTQLATSFFQILGRGEGDWVSTPVVMAAIINDSCILVRTSSILAAANLLGVSFDDCDSNYMHLR